MNISVMAAMSRVSKCQKNALYIVCFKLVLEMVSWFSSNGMICILLSFCSNEVEGASCTRIGPGQAVHDLANCCLWLFINCLYLNWLCEANCQSFANYTYGNGRCMAV